MLTPYVNEAKQEILCQVRVYCYFIFSYYVIIVFVLYAVDERENLCNVNHKKFRNIFSKAFARPISYLHLLEDKKPFCSAIVFKENNVPLSILNNNNYSLYNKIVFLATICFQKDRNFKGYMHTQKRGYQKL